MPINKSNIKPFACRVTRINGTRNKSITSNLARKGLNIGIITVAILSIMLVNVSSNVDASENVLFTVNASAPSVEISVPSAVGFDITPSSDGVFGYTSFNVTAGSNNSDGYTLTMYTTDLTNPTDLKGNDTGTLIQTLTAKANSAGYTRNEFTTNRWGYKYCFNGSNGTTTGNHITKLCSAAEDLYYPVIDKDVSGNTLTTTTGAHNAETTTVTLATKLDNNIPADSYSTILTFIVTANASTDTSSFDRAFYANGKTTYANTGLYAMQDMNSAICSQVKNDNEARLIDKRDNKVYWVAKLKNSRTPANEYDGKCWMTQGLGLDLSSSVALTSQNTDLNSYKLEGSETNFDGYTYSNGIISWMPTNSTIDSSEKIIVLQESDNAISSSNFAPGWDNNDSGNETPASSNPGSRYLAPTVATKSYDYYYNLTDIFYPNLTDCNNAMSESAHSAFNSDCSHYALGHYYNFAAATATNNVSGTVGHEITDGTVMPNSICPANWRLPNGITTDTNGNTVNSEFDTLLYAYSVTNLVGVTVGQVLYWNNNSQTAGYTALNAMRNTPLYFARPGGIQNAGDLLYAGVNGSSWSNTTGNIAPYFGNFLDFNSTRVTLSYTYYRSYGIPVRCLAR